MKVISAKYRLFPISFSLLHIFAKTNGMIINKITRGANAENDGPAVITIENVNNKYKPKDMKKYSNLPVVLLKEKKLGSFLPIINCESPHPIEFIYQFTAPLSVTVQQNFRIRVICFKFMATIL